MSKDVYSLYIMICTDQVKFIKRGCALNLNGDIGTYNYILNRYRGVLQGARYDT